MVRSNWRQFLGLLAYARPYKKWLVAQFGCMALAVGVGLLKPWPLKVLVDNVVNGQDFVLIGRNLAERPGLLLLLACLAYLLLHAGDSLIQLISANMATFSASSMIKDLRVACMRRLQELPLRYHQEQKVGDLVHRVAYNTAAVETAVQSGFMGTVKSLLTLVCLFVVMLWMNAPLTFVALAIAPFLLLCARWYAKRIHRISRTHHDQEGSVLSAAQEILGAIRLVQAFNRQEFEERRFGEICAGSVWTRLRSLAVQKLFGLITAVILAAGTAALFWAGIGQVQSGALTLGEFLVFVAYLAMLYAPLSVLSSTASSVQSAMGGASRLFDILDAPNEMEEAPNAPALSCESGAIVFESVCFGYLPDRDVLHDVNLTVKPGSLTAIVGETGSGKTTLINLTLRFFPLKHGRILIDGQDIADVTLRSLREAAGLVPQETYIFSGSIRENIAYGRPGASHEVIEAAARMAEAHSFISDAPLGYDTLVGEDGARLSAGQRQRMAWARVFLKKPKILLLDEPTSALDGETEARLLDCLQVFRERQTVLFVTHRLAAARMADVVVVLSDGRIVEAGRHEELLERRGPYHRMWRAQMEELASATAG